MENRKILLWVDDCRNPFDEKAEWTSFSPVPFDYIVWVRNYYQFTDYIDQEGLPYVVCFDHDLGEDSDGYTGKDCANYLVDYCMDNKLQIPYFASQSSNPAGRENILSLLENYKRFFESKDWKTCRKSYSNKKNR